MVGSLSLEVAPHRSPKPMGSKCGGDNKRVERIWIRASPSLYGLVFDLMHFRNLLLLFIHRYHDAYGVWVTSLSILYSLFAKPNVRSTRNSAKMARISEILRNVGGDPELSTFLECLREQKNRIDNNYLAQQVIRQVCRDFSNYFKALREYAKNPSKFTGTPKPPRPKKLRNIGRFTIEFNKNTYIQSSREIILRLRVKQRIQYSFKVRDGVKATSVRLCYYLGQYYIDVVYENNENTANPLKP